MIPRVAADIDELVEEGRRQLQEVDGLIGGLDAGSAAWRPSPKKWSVAGHITHLGIVNGEYLQAITTRIARAKSEGGPSGQGPFRHPRFTTWFAGSMEPPPKRRFKTLRSMVPDPAADVETALAEFGRTQRQLITAIQDARELDWGRVRFSSPFFALLRFSLGTGVELLLAHNRRHIWLAREVMAEVGFPTSTGGADEDR